MMKYAGEMLSRFPGGVVDTKLYSNGRKTGFPFFFFSRVNDLKYILVSLQWPSLPFILQTERFTN